MPHHAPSQDDVSEACPRQDNARGIMPQPYGRTCALHAANQECPAGDLYKKGKGQPQGCQAFAPDPFRPCLIPCPVDKGVPEAGDQETEGRQHMEHGPVMPHLMGRMFSGPMQSETGTYRGGKPKRQHAARTELETVFGNVGTVSSVTPVRACQHGDIVFLHRFFECKGKGIIGPFQWTDRGFPRTIQGVSA